MIEIDTKQHNIYGLNRRDVEIITGDFRPVNWDIPEKIPEYLPLTASPHSFEEK